MNLKAKMRKLKPLCQIFYGRRSVKKNTFLFYSFFGMYNDNPKYISIKLHERYPDAKIIWVRSARSHEKFPDYIETVEYASAEFYQWTYRAQVVIDNMLGIRPHDETSSTGKRLLKFFVRSLAPRRKKRQYNISTWHGTPLKRLGADRFDAKKPKRKRIQGSCDSMPVGCYFTRDVIKRAYFKEFDVPLNLYGTPRNDILFDKTIDVKVLKKKLKLPIDKKIILFAPTFRDDSVDESGVAQMNEIDFNRLFRCLEERFGGDWRFVFRVHHSVITRVDTERLAAECGDRIIDGNVGDDMAEYMVCADVLLTDYSSSMFDFALTKKPCLLFCPDREHYENDVRGVYLSIDELPFPISYDNEGLQSCIQTFDREKYTRGVEELLVKIGNVEDGRASERVVEDIKYFLDTGIKR